MLSGHINQKIRKPTIGAVTSDSATVAAIGQANAALPNGAIVTSFKVYWNRIDALAAGSISLYRIDTSGGGSIMATADSNSSAGNHTVEDTSISFATIDNTQYTYLISVGLDPNDAAGDVALFGALITYTIVAPLP